MSNAIATIYEDIVCAYDHERWHDVTAKERAASGLWRWLSAHDICAELGHAQTAYNKGLVRKAFELLPLYCHAPCGDYWVPQLSVNYIRTVESQA